MRILLWHVHGSWTTAFVQGPHTCVVPVTPDRGPDGLGRARTFDWPDSVVEVPAERLRDEHIDVVVLQRPHEPALGDRLLGRRPPLVHVEHDAPHGNVPDTRHPAADIPGVTLAHVTHFNRLMRDAGPAPTAVTEHGVVDPGHRWTGELPRAAVVVNEPVRRGRATRTDLLPAFAAAAPLDVLGLRTEHLAEHLALPPDRCRAHELTQARPHTEMSRRRVHVHPVRRTSLGLSLLETMHLGMPVVALATTEVTESVPAGAGVVSNRIDVLTEAVRGFVADPLRARLAGGRARAAALARYGLSRFLDDWERLLKEVTR